MTAVLGVIVGVGVTVLGGAPSPDGVVVGAGNASAGGISIGGTSAVSVPSGSPSSVAALPPVSPVTGNAPVIGGTALGGALEAKSAVRTVAAGAEARWHRSPGR